MHDGLNVVMAVQMWSSDDLTQYRKVNRKSICSDIMVLDDLENIITCGGTWIFQYDVETKGPLSRQWKKYE
jgi:hypothetical protein